MIARRIVLVSIFECLIRLLLMSQATSIQIIPERPEVTYWNQEYLNYLNFTARRASRRDPVVMNIHMSNKEPWGNNITISQAFSIQVIPERPEITYWNKEYLDFANFTARRASRRDPVVINIYGITKSPWGNNVTIDLVFFEFLSNMYKRSFVEFHYKLCNLVQQEKFVGRLIYEAGLKNLTCPYPPKTYALINMAFHPSYLPSSFPLTKGRVNIRITQNEKDELIAAGHMHLTVLETQKSSRTNRKN